MGNKGENRNKTGTHQSKKRSSNLKLEEIEELMNTDDEISGSNETDADDWMNGSDTADKKEESEIRQDLDYQPIHFLRCHSRNNDSSDMQTQIWQCLFEPDMDNPNKTTSVVATCGGNSICLVNVQTGKVSLKYNHSDKRELFYALAWGILRLDSTGTRRTNILAAGGKMREVRLIHPAQGVCYHEFKVSPGKGKNVFISSLLFHSVMSSWLFCGSSAGEITLWDIGTPNLPDYDVSPQQLLSLNAAAEVYNLVYSLVHSCLMAGCDEGLQGWQLTVESVQNQKRPAQIYFELPHHPADDHKPVVDSLKLVNDRVVATKCALHGCIYLWDLENTMTACYKAWKRKKVTDTTVSVKMLHKLHWSYTDHYYMNVGCRGDQGLLCCGDDEGTIWIYNIRSILDGSANTSEYMLQPAKKLYWPELEDEYLEISRKISLDHCSIIVDSVVINSAGNYIVAVTSNNMVCVWERR